MKITEEDIRPEKVFDEYLRLTAADTITYFSDVEKIEIPCPACGGNEGKDWVKKSLFLYKKCPSCHTIYVSPRPVVESFNTYYTDSPSTKFWASTFYKVTEIARREKLWKPKAKLVKEKITALGTENPINYIVDIGGGYGVFDEEIKIIMDVDVIVIEPSVHLAEICRNKGLTVIEKFMEEVDKFELPIGRKCFVSFELFEHLHNPEKFLITVFENMEVDDLFIFTTLSGMGIDIQLLGSQSKALSPPHHLNFFNPKSITLLLEKIGYKVFEANTPGKLDMDILNKNKSAINDIYWKNVFDYFSKNDLDNLQNCISNLGLSSHMMIVCAK